MSNLSEEEIHAIRVCWLIMRVGRDVTRKTLDSIFPQGSGPGTLDGKLNRPSTKATLNGGPGSTKKYFTNFDLSQLYPVPRVTISSKDFDVSLLIKLLRNICSLGTPRNGWDNMPNPRDTSLIDDLARIKYYRNKIAHGEFSLTADEFDDYWTELSNALIRIGGASLKPTIESFLVDPLTEEAEEAKKELEKWYMMEIDVNKKFDKQFDKLEKEIEQLGLMCRTMEEKYANLERFKNLQHQFTCLVDEINAVRTISSEQQTTQLQYLESAVDNIRERLKGIEKKMTGKQNAGDIIRFVVAYGLPVAVLIVAVFLYWPEQKPGIFSFKFQYLESTMYSIREQLKGIDKKIDGNQNTGDILRFVVAFGLPLTVLCVAVLSCWSKSNSDRMPVNSSLRSLAKNFVGRDKDVSKIMHLLESGQMVTVKAPYGFGTSEVAVAVGHKMLADDTHVFHVDMCDSGQTVSGKLVTILGFVPLPDTLSHLNSICRTLKKTLLIFDNVDCISDKKDLKIDFEKTLRLLNDRNICVSIYILCATQQSFTVLTNLGIEYPLDPLDIDNAAVLLSRTNPRLPQTAIRRLAETSTGIPLAINLINDLLVMGQAPNDIIKEIENDIENLEKVFGLEETKKLITVALQYLRKQDSSVQDALKRLSHVFDGSFDSSAAKAVIDGSDFEKQHVLSHLHGSSLVTISNACNGSESRFFIHPFLRKLVKDKIMVLDEVKCKTSKLYIDYFAEFVYNASSLWFSKHSKNATQQFLTEESNILKMFDLSNKIEIRLFERSTIWLITDIIVVKALDKFFKPQILLDFYKTIEKVVDYLEKHQTTEEMSMFLNVCFAHIHLGNNEYDEAYEYLQNYMKLEAKTLVTFPRYEVVSRIDFSRVYIKKDELYESVKLLDVALSTLVESLPSSGDDILLLLGDSLGEVSYLFYSYYDNIDKKYKMFSKENDKLWVEHIYKNPEISSLCDRVVSMSLPFDCDKIVETVGSYEICRGTDLNSCLQHILQISLLAQSRSLSIFKHLLGDNHVTTAYHYDRLAFLLHNSNKFEQAIAYRKKAIENRELALNGFHPDVAWSYYGLGTSFEQLNKFDDALKAYRSSLEIRDLYLGKHYLTANSHFKIGEICQKLDRIDESIKAFAAAVEIRKHINDNPESIARALRAYGDLLSSTGDEVFQEEANKLYKEERRHLWMKTHDEAMKRLEIQENERTGQGEHGYGQSVFSLDDGDEEQKPYYWINMQVSNQGKVISHGYVPDGSDKIISTGFVPEDNNDSERTFFA